MQLVVLNGFDRSGTSFIGGMLARHPQVNYFFQPFSSTDIHRAQYEIWGDEDGSPAAESFLRSMREGRIERDFIASDWFDRFSEYDLEDNRGIGIIKETKLHTKIDWLRRTLQGIEIYGIWREPVAVLCSLLRNGFHRKWYGSPAFEKTCSLIRQDERLFMYKQFMNESLGEEARMALIIAVRTQLMISGLGPDKWLVYERVLSDPDDELNRFCRNFGLNEFGFSSRRHKDFNVIGLRYQRQDLWKDYFRDAMPAQVEQILGTINQEPDAPQSPARSCSEA